jgi:hypothetical protein
MLRYCGSGDPCPDREGVRISAYSDGNHLAYLPVWG